MRLVPIGGRTADHRRAGRPVRVLASMTALAAGLLAVAGCQACSSSTAAPTFSGADNVVRVAQTPGVGDAPLFIAFQQGLFRKAGLQVRITNYSSTRAELTALRAGQGGRRVRRLRRHVLRAGAGAGAGQGAQAKAA